MPAENILIGLGNPIMSDDGIGPLVSEEVYKRLPGYNLEMSRGGGFDVVDRMLGFKRAVIIDSMLTGKHDPGTVVRVDPEHNIETMRVTHSHGLNFLDAIEVARACKAPLPSEIIIYGIEIVDPFSFGQEISAAVLGRLDEAVDRIVSDLEAGPPES